MRCKGEFSFWKLKMTRASETPAPESVGQNGRAVAGGLLRRQDGRVLDDLIDDGQAPPEHVVGILWDGTNANVLYDLVAKGMAPNVARLMAMGTTYAHGAMSSLPTVTLANHTSILTGAHPGHHGILNNAWYDRRIGEQVITNSPATWPWAMTTLSPEVETMYQAVKRTWSDAFTQYINNIKDLNLSDPSSFTNPATMQKIQDASKPIESSDFKTAETNIQAYFNKCQATP